MNSERRWLFYGGWLVFGLCSTLLFSCSDIRVLLLARNTLLLCLAVCAVSLPLGTLLALLLMRTDIPLKRATLLLVVALLFMPLYLYAAAWDAGFGKLGWATLLNGALDAPLLNRWTAAIWIHGTWSVAWVTLIVASALRLTEPELEEQAWLDGTAWQVFLSVTLRRALPGVMMAAIWVTLTTASEMVVTDLYQIRTLAEELYTGFAMVDDPGSTFGLTAALLFTGALASLAVILLNAVMVAAEHIPVRTPRIFSLGRYRSALVLTVTLFLLILAGIPFGNLAFQAGTVVEQVGGGPVRSWSLWQFFEILVPLPGTWDGAAVVRFHQQFLWTITIGVCSASAAMLIAIPLGWLARAGGIRLAPAMFFAAIGLATMGPLLGVALIWIFTRSDHPAVVWLYDRTILAPVVAVTLRSMPLPILIATTAFGSLSPSMLDAASIDGTGPIHRMIRIGARQRLPALGLAWLIAFAVACGELSASILVVPPGVSTIPIRVFGLLHAGVGNEVAAICVTSMCGVVLLAIIIRSVAGLLRR
jgi:iron(III) transport system permease protein